MRVERARIIRFKLLLRGLFRLFKPVRLGLLLGLFLGFFRGVLLFLFGGWLSSAVVLLCAFRSAVKSLRGATSGERAPP